MTDCPNCEIRDSMYETASGKEKCWKCGHTRTRQSRTSERPNRPPDASCGEVLLREDGKTKISHRERMNEDDSFCEGKPRGIEETLVEDAYVVVCSRHRD